MDKLIVAGSIIVVALYVVHQYLNTMLDAMREYKDEENRGDQ